VYQRILKSLEVIGVSSAEQKEVWRLLAALLYLGNAHIDEADTSEGLKAHIPDNDETNFDFQAATAFAAKKSKQPRGGQAGRYGQGGSGVNKMGSSKACVAKAATLLGIPSDALEALVLVKKTKVVGEKEMLTIKLLGAEARFRRDAVRQNKIRTKMGTREME
jgi:myosin heavy subunit